MFDKANRGWAWPPMIAPIRADAKPLGMVVAASRAPKGVGASGWAMVLFLFQRSSLFCLSRQLCPLCGKAPPEKRRWPRRTSESHCRVTYSTSDAPSNNTTATVATTVIARKALSIRLIPAPFISWSALERDKQTDCMAALISITTGNLSQASPCLRSISLGHLQPVKPPQSNVAARSC